MADVDWKNLYKWPATPGERLRGEELITQFGRMCRKLGIALVAASSTILRLLHGGPARGSLTWAVYVQ
jgi:hypothetical protein